jgi:tripartite-type tricarboxylate transporter receptor subunit TctC
MISRRQLIQAATASVCARAAPAFAQQFPAGRPIKIITAVAPGSATDVTARFIADALSKRLGVGVIVDPRPGAGGVVAAQEVARAAADGHTLLYGGIGHYIAQPLAGTQTYDAVKDFAPIAKVASASVAFIVPTASPYKTLGEMVRAMRDKPGKLTFSSGGIGAAAHLCGVMLNEATQTTALHVPYKGTGAAVIDVASGLVDFTCQSAAAFIPALQTGKVRLLAVASRQRWPQFPDVPTASEAGVPDFHVSSWMGALAPSGTPAPIIKTLSDEFLRIARSPEFKALCEKQTIDVDPVDHAQWAADAAREEASWRRIATLLRKQ